MKKTNTIRLKQLGAFLMTLVMLFGISTYATVNAAAPSISKKTKTIVRTCKFTLAVNNTNGKVKWSSSNKKVATVKAKGNTKAVVTGVKGGKAKITGTVGGKKYTCVVTVNNTGLNKSKITRKVGKTAKIRFIGNAKPKWSTSNKKIVKITSSTSKYARIKAVKAGTAYIKAKVGGKTYKCKVTVKSSKKIGKGQLTDVAKQNKKNKEIANKIKKSRNQEEVALKYVKKIKINDKNLAVKIETFVSDKATCDAVKKRLQEEINYPADAATFDTIKITITNKTNNFVAFGLEQIVYGMMLGTKAKLNHTQAEIDARVKQGYVPFLPEKGDRQYIHLRNCDHHQSFSYHYLKPNETCVNYYHAEKNQTFNCTSKEPIQLYMWSSDVFYNNSRRGYLYFPATKKSATNAGNWYYPLNKGPYNHVSLPVPSDRMEEFYIVK